MYGGYNESNPLIFGSKAYFEGNPFNGWVGFLIPGMIVLSSPDDRQNALWMKAE